MRRGGLILGGIAVLLVAGFLVLSYTRGRFIQTRLEHMVRPGLTVAKINAGLTHLSVKGIQYADPSSGKRLAQVEEMRIYPSLLSVLGRTVQIRKCTLLKPSFFFYRSRDGVFTGPFPKAERESHETAKTAQESSPGGGDGKIHAPAVTIDRLQIEQGSLDFEDQKTGGPTAYVGLRDLELEIKDLQYPLSSIHSPIELKGKFKGITKEGTLSSKGWIDLRTANMEMTLRAEEIEFRAFEPYYRKRVTAVVSSGHANLEARIILRDQRIDVPGEIDLENVVVKEGKGSVFYIPAKNLIQMLKDKGHRVKARFRIRGNLDDPRFNLWENVASRLSLALAGSLGLPVTVVGEGAAGDAAGEAGGMAEGQKPAEGHLGEEEKVKE